MQIKDNISFVGKPFPLEEAEDHFRKLKETGENSFKLAVHWEAIEHEGPGIYDEAYLAYLRKILITAEKEGISVYIEPHHYDAAAMCSLFFAEKSYAPDLQIESENIQDWLQSHYIAAFKHAQRRLKNCKAISGWGNIS